MASRKTSRDWIVCHDGTKGDLAYACECKRCGEIQRFVIPINLEMWLAAAKVFGRQHKSCKEAKNSGEPLDG